MLTGSVVDLCHARLIVWLFCSYLNFWKPWLNAVVTCEIQYFEIISKLFQCFVSHITAALETLLFLVHSRIFRISGSSSYISVIGSRSRSQEQTSSWAVAERPHDSCDFKWVGHSEAKFYVEVWRFSPMSVDRYTGEWSYYNFTAGSFHTKKLCSRLCSIEFY